MKLGQLVDAIRRLEDAERDVADAKQAVSHGGNAQTMKGKHLAVENAEWWLAEIRNEDIPV